MMTSTDRLESINALLQSCALPLTKVTLDFAWYLTASKASSLHRLMEKRKAEGQPITEDWVQEALNEYTASNNMNAGPDTNDAISGELAVRAETVTQTLERALTRQETDVSDFAGELAQGREGLSGTDPSTAIDRLGMSVVTALDRITETEAELAEARKQIASMKDDLENARTEARQDHLTKLANRRAFKSKFEEFAKVRQRTCLAIVDLDKFKAVNDSHGHPVGDRVLKTVADHLSSEMPHAFVSRYGGEEFAILFGNTSLREAQTALETTREKLHARKLRLKATNTYLDQLNYSAGVIELEHKEAYESAMSRTDELLYEAKARGRGRTMTILDLSESKNNVATLPKSNRTAASAKVA